MYISCYRGLGTLYRAHSYVKIRVTQIYQCDNESSADLPKLRDTLKKKAAANNIFLHRKLTFGHAPYKYHCPLTLRNHADVYVSKRSHLERKQMLCTIIRKVISIYTAAIKASDSFSSKFLHQHLTKSWREVTLNDKIFWARNLISLTGLTDVKMLNFFSYRNPLTSQL